MWASKRGPQESPSYAAQVPSTAPWRPGSRAPPGCWRRRWRSEDLRSTSWNWRRRRRSPWLRKASEMVTEAWGVLRLFEWDFLSGIFWMGLVGDRLKIFENSDWYSVGFNGISLGFHGIEWPLGFRWEIEHQESRDFIRFKLDVDIMRYNNQLTIIHHHNSPY